MQPYPQLQVIAWVQLLRTTLSEHQSMPVLDAGAASWARARPPTAKPCHNCRRARLRCDRSLPFCEKCHARGESCLGYGQLFRWAGVGAVTVRGRLAGKPTSQELRSGTVLRRGDRAFTKTAHDAGQILDSSLPVLHLQSSLADPLLQALAPQHRMYISHCESGRRSGLVSFEVHGT